MKKKRMNVVMVPKSKAREAQAIFSVFFLSVVEGRRVGLRSTLVRKNQKWNGKVWLYCSPLGHLSQFLHHLSFRCLLVFFQMGEKIKTLLY